MGGISAVKIKPQKLVDALKKDQPRLSPLKLARQISQQLEVLPTVRFSFFANNLESAYSLPNKIGQIFFKEELVDINGYKNPAKLKKLKNPLYLKNLKAKIIYAIVQNWLKTVFKQGLINNLSTAEYLFMFKEEELNLLIDFFSQRYSQQTAALFLAQANPELLSWQQAPPTPIKTINDFVQKKTQQLLKQEFSLIKETIAYIKQYDLSNLSLEQKSFTAKTAKKIITALGLLARFPSRLTIDIDPKTFPAITLSEESEE